MSEFALETEPIREIENAALVVIHGAVDAKATGFRETLTRLRIEGVTRFVLDLKDVTFMNSAALGFLVNLNDPIPETEGGIWIANLPPKVKTVFEMMGLSEMFFLVPTRTAGVDSVVNKFSVKPPPLPPIPAAPPGMKPAAGGPAAPAGGPPRPAPPAGPPSGAPVPRKPGPAGPPVK